MSGPMIDPAQDLITKAVDAIGDNHDDDYEIKPSRFPEIVADLKPVLSHATLTQTAERYECKDADALAARDAHKASSHASTWLLFIAATSAALVAAISGFEPDPGPETSTSLIRVISLSNPSGNTTGALLVISNKI